MTVLCQGELSANPDFSSLPFYASFQLVQFFFYLLALFLFVFAPAVTCFQRRRGGNKIRRKRELGKSSWPLHHDDCSSPQSLQWSNLQYRVQVSSCSFWKMSTVSVTRTRACDTNSARSSNSTRPWGSFPSSKGKFWGTIQCFASGGEQRHSSRLWPSVRYYSGSTSGSPFDSDDNFTWLRTPTLTRLEETCFSGVGKMAE